MKKILSLSLFLSVFILMIFLPHLNVYPEESLPQSDSPPEISMDFKDANLKDVLKLFSIQSGMNFIASGAVQERKITLYLDKVPVEQAMDKLFKANNLSYDYYRDSNIFIVKEWGRLQVETETRIFYLKHAMVFREISITTCPECHTVSLIEKADVSLRSTKRQVLGSYFVKIQFRTVTKAHFSVKIGSERIECDKHCTLLPIQLDKIGN